MDKANLFRIDMEAPEVVVQLVALHPEIECVKFQEYSPHTLGIRKTLAEQKEISVKTILRHHPDVKEYAIRLQREDVTEEMIWKLIDAATKREKAFVLCSQIETHDDHIMHIPMLDFECDVSGENLSKIIEFVNEIKEAGVILESGRSYHYYGFNLLDEKRWIKFMARSLLFTGFIDSRHIGHRILSSEARLRLAKIKGSDRYLMTPKVVAIVE